MKTCPTVQLVAAYNSTAEFCIRPESYIYLNFSVNFRKPIKLLNHIIGAAQLTGHCIDLLLKRANVSERVTRSHKLLALPARSR